MEKVYKRLIVTQFMNDKTTQKTTNNYKQDQHQIALDLIISICNINVIVIMCMHSFQDNFSSKNSSKNK